MTVTERAMRSEEDEDEDGDGDGGREVCARYAVCGEC